MIIKIPMTLFELWIFVAGLSCGLFCGLMIAGFARRFEDEDK